MFPFLLTSFLSRCAVRCQHLYVFRNLWPVFVQGSFNKHRCQRMDSDIVVHGFFLCLALFCWTLVVGTYSLINLTNSHARCCFFSSERFSGSHFLVYHWACFLLFLLTASKTPAPHCIGFSFHVNAYFEFFNKMLFRIFQSCLLIPRHLRGDLGSHSPFSLVISKGFCP